MQQAKNNLLEIQKKISATTAFLPVTSFVPFNARRCNEPQELWKNEKQNNVSFNLKEYAICSPLVGEASNSFEAERLELFSDRYGGDGIRNHGGGVRCAIWRGMQIKGVGSNILSSRKPTDFFHSYGGASLQEGIRDSLWGEVCNIALPYGAVRVAGLIGTGTTVPLKYPALGKSPVSPRALIVREPALRPAHYLRAIFHAAKPEMEKFASDVLRTQAAVGSLRETLTVIFARSSTRDLSGDCIENLLRLMVDRFALQIATARAKRLMHGSLGASNIAVDGRWLDFGTMSTLSDYGRIIIARGLHDFQTEEEGLFDCLSNLSYYVNKYSDSLHLSTKISATSLVSYLRQQLATHCEVEFIKLSGIPQDLLCKIPRRVRGEFYKHITTITKKGNSEPFKLLNPDPAYVPVMPEKMGDFSLNTILSTLAISSSKIAAESFLKVLINDEHLRTCLIVSYFDLREAALSALPIAQSKSAALFISVNSLRKNALFPELFRTVLNPNIDKIVESSSNISEFIDPIVGKARTLFGEEKNGVIDLSWWFAKHSTYSIKAGLCIDGLNTCVSNVPSFIRGHVNIVSMEYISSLCKKPT